MVFDEPTVILMTADGKEIFVPHPLPAPLVVYRNFSIPKQYKLDWKNGAVWKTLTKDVAYVTKEFLFDGYSVHFCWQKHLDSMITELMPVPLYFEVPKKQKP